LSTVGGFILAARWITISVVEISCLYYEQNRIHLNLVTTTEVVPLTNSRYNFSALLLTSLFTRLTLAVHEVLDLSNVLTYTTL
jgi:hypothetical protein